MLIMCIIYIMFNISNNVYNIINVPGKTAGITSCYTAKDKNSFLCELFANYYFGIENIIKIFMQCRCTN